MDYGAETGGVDYILPEFEMVSCFCFVYLRVLMGSHHGVYRSGNLRMTRRTIHSRALLIALKDRLLQQTICTC